MGIVDARAAPLGCTVRRDLAYPRHSSDPDPAYVKFDGLDDLADSIGCYEDGCIVSQESSIGWGRRSGRDGIQRPSGFGDEKGVRAMT